MTDHPRDSHLEQTLQAFETLTSTQRLVLLLAYAEGLTQPEIAARLDLPVDAVRSAAASALRLVAAGAELEQRLRPR